MGCCVRCLEKLSTSLSQPGVGSAEALASDCMTASLCHAEEDILVHSRPANVHGLHIRSGLIGFDDEEEDPIRLKVEG